MIDNPNQTKPIYCMSASHKLTLTSFSHSMLCLCSHVYICNSTIENKKSTGIGKHNYMNSCCKPQTSQGPSWPWSYGSWIYNYLCNQCLSPLMLRVRISIRARCTTICDKVCQWLATGQWFSPGPPISSTSKTDRHDITELLLKVV